MFLHIYSGQLILKICKYMYRVEGCNKLAVVVCCCYFFAVQTGGGGLSRSLHQLVLQVAGPSLGGGGGSSAICLFIGRVTFLRTLTN